MPRYTIQSHGAAANQDRTTNRDADEHETQPRSNHTPRATYDLIVHDSTTAPRLIPYNAGTYIYTPEPTTQTFNFSATQQQPRSQQRSAPTYASMYAPPPPARPQFRSKAVCLLDCRYCQSSVCKRGMKAILLADMAIELFSTDLPPKGVALVFEDYQTHKCKCRIRDVACLGCGNVIGYHVTQPCTNCMDACNNGHFWMFHVEHVASAERSVAGKASEVLCWAELGPEKEETGEGIMCR